MNDLIVKMPLVYVTRGESEDDAHTRVSFYVNDIMIMDLDIQKDIVPPSGEVDPMLLTQLLVTPHEFMALLVDFVSMAKANQTEGERWEALVARTEKLLTPPSPPTEVK